MELLSSEDAAELCGVNVRTFRRLVHKDQVPVARRLHGSPYYETSVVLDYRSRWLGSRTPNGNESGWRKELLAAMLKEGIPDSTLREQNPADMAWRLRGGKKIGAKSINPHSNPIPPDPSDPEEPVREAVVQEMQRLRVGIWRYATLLGVEFSTLSTFLQRRRRLPRSVAWAIYQHCWFGYDPLLACMKATAG